MRTCDSREADATKDATRTHEFDASPARARKRLQSWQLCRSPDLGYCCPISSLLLIPRDPCDAIMGIHCSQAMFTGVDFLQWFLGGDQFDCIVLLGSVRYVTA